MTNKTAPTPATDKLEELLIAAIRLAIIRWDLRDDEGDISDEQAREIAEDTAWACQGEGTCDDTPIPEWNAATEASRDMLAALQAARPLIACMIKHYQNGGSWTVNLDELDQADSLINAAIQKAGHGL